MNAAELKALPAVIDVPTAARALGLGRAAAYQLVKEGQWPTPVFRVGKQIRIPTAPLLALLCVEDGDGAQAPWPLVTAG